MLIGFSTALTMIAFAANSVLCRIALGGGLIDPVSFMILRLVSGASFLLVVAQSRSQPIGPQARKIGGSWASGIALFAYAAAFSLAYVTLQTGTGALILFGSVQATMIGAGLRSGERPHPAQWLGLGVAVIGLVYLVFPGIEAPGILGASLMSISGVSWGVYSLRGASEEAPLLSTSGNFIRALPMALLLSTIAASTLHADFSGVVLAVISGAITSGLGYVLWYRALRGLTTTRAAIVQLVVPILAALGGIVFMGELVTTRFVVATALVLGGVAVALLGRVSKCGVSEPQVRAAEAHAGDGGQA
ncbi:MAG: DMT family transporter [Acidobacteriota bacterium]